MQDIQLADYSKARLAGYSNVYELTFTDVNVKDIVKWLKFMRTHIVFVSVYSILETLDDRGTYLSFIGFKLFFHQSYIASRVERLNCCVSPVSTRFPVTTLRSVASSLSAAWCASALAYHTRYCLHQTCLDLSVFDKHFMKETGVTIGCIDYPLTVIARMTSRSFSNEIYSSHDICNHVSDEHTDLLVFLGMYVRAYMIDVSAGSVFKQTNRITYHRWRGVSLMIVRNMSPWLCLSSNGYIYFSRNVVDWASTHLREYISKKKKI